MLIICKECGYEAPQHADWCSQRMSNIEVCPICRGARGKHAPYCHLNPSHKPRVWNAQEVGSGVKVVFGSEPSTSHKKDTRAVFFSPRSLKLLGMTEEEAELKFVFPPLSVFSIGEKK